MKYQLIFDAATGKLKRKMGYQARPLREDEVEVKPLEVGLGEIEWIETEPATIQQIKDNDVELLDGALVFTLKAPPPPPGYRELRAVEYAQKIPIGDQLDAILKHLEPQVVPGTDLEKIVENWRQAKAKYPKP